MHVVVAVRKKHVAQRRENSWFVLAEIVGEDEIQCSPRFGLIFVMPAWVIPVAAALHLLDGQPKEEQVLLTGLFGHFNRCSIASPNGERTVHHEFHIARSTRFITRGRDLVRNIARGNQPFGKRDVVLWQENDLYFSPYRRIGVDDRRKIVEKFDGQLGQVIGRRRLARKEKRARHKLKI